MKKMFHKIIFATFILCFAACGVFAMEGKYEQFAREYMPQIQRVYERLATERGEAISLRNEIVKEVKEFFPELIDKKDGIKKMQFYCFLTEKIDKISQKNQELSDKVEEYYWQHQTSEIEADDLENYDEELTQKTLKWKQEQIDNILSNVWNF